MSTLGERAGRVDVTRVVDVPRLVEGSDVRRELHVRVAVRASRVAEGDLLRRRVRGAGRGRPCLAVVALVLTARPRLGRGARAAEGLAGQQCGCGLVVVVQVGLEGRPARQRAQVELVEACLKRLGVQRDGSDEALRPRTTNRLLPHRDDVVRRTGRHRRRCGHAGACCGENRSGDDGEPAKPISFLGAATGGGVPVREHEHDPDPSVGRTERWTTAAVAQQAMEALQGVTL